VILDIHRAIDSTQLPQLRILSLVRESQFTARIEQPAYDHNQAVFDPGLLARVDGLVQLHLFGQLEEGETGPVLFGLKSLERVGRALGNDLLAEGGLDEFELVQGQAGDASVVFMLDMTVLTIG